MNLMRSAVAAGRLRPQPAVAGAGRRRQSRLDARRGGCAGTIDDRGVRRRAGLPRQERSGVRWPGSGARRMAIGRRSSALHAPTLPAINRPWTRCSRASSTCWSSSTATSTRSFWPCAVRPIWSWARSCPSIVSPPGTVPGSHFNQDWFANKLALTVLLNFPLTTLEQRLSEGDDWTRRQWAETRLAQRFSSRVPAEVNQAIAAADARADQYIADYNIWMHHLLDDQGQRLFPARMKLLSHWNLRDQIKADYSETDGLVRQRMIQRVMERIVDQTIPEVVIDNPTVDWDPYTNQVTAATVTDSDRPVARWRRSEQCAGARHPVRGAAEPVPRDAAAGSIFAHGADPHRSQVQRGPGDPRERGSRRCWSRSCPRPRSPKSAR